ncbi:metal-sulfur cluster assembly factor [Nocardia australiensis]|uniref:metal-sulfur cluster assembly factor n=1 Tax=Nocardia australiensis TaxID=2887191 RepID=UPI001D1331B7|nr:iron-sulfur cluster assembly protein [Nocardia australiensis]
MSTSVVDRVWAALDTVRDPELDESITALRFVSEVRVDENGGARVRLRLPTYFCAPNFAYLMVADAHDAVGSANGVSTVTVELEDHFAAQEINAGVAAAAGFVGSFPAEAADELGDLRVRFQRKAYIAALERAVRTLAAAAAIPDTPDRLRLGDIPAGPEQQSLHRRRAAIGLGWDPGDPLLVDEFGAVITADGAAKYLRFARTVRVSIEGNAHFCRGLLATRYDDTNGAKL